MFRIALALLICCGAGCVTRKVSVDRLAKITPPPIKSRAAAIPFKVYRAREMMRLEWGDCGPQPDGVLYQIFHRTNLTNEWSFYAETSFHFLPIQFTNQGLNIFAVRAVAGTNYSLFAGTNCPAEK